MDDGLPCKDLRLEDTGDGLWSWKREQLQFIESCFRIGDTFDFYFHLLLRIVVLFLEDGFPEKSNKGMNCRVLYTHPISW